jgi:hypothetical protein
MALCSDKYAVSGAHIQNLRIRLGPIGDRVRAGAVDGNSWTNFRQRVALVKRLVDRVCPSND